MRRQSVGVLMPLQTQMVAVPFAKGINTKLDAKHVMPGELLVLENGIFDKIGSIHKRKGYDIKLVTLFDTDKELDEAAAIFGRDAERYLLGRQITKSGDVTNQDDGWIVYSMDINKGVFHKVGTSMPFGMSVNEGLRADRRWIMPDMAIDDNYTCYVTVEDTGIGADGKVYYTIQENSTKAKILGNIELSDTDMYSPHVLALDGNTFSLWAASPTTNEMVSQIYTQMHWILHPPHSPWKYLIYMPMGYSIFAKSMIL